MDTLNFRHLLSHFPSGVTVVSALGGDRRPYGLTVSAFCSVSVEPALVLVCVDLASNTLPAIRESGRFTVNILAADQEETALRFASKADDKFDGVAWHMPRGMVGGPILDDGCCAYLACSVVQEVPGGDHVVFLGRVEEGSGLDDTGTLIYGRRLFGSWPQQHLPVTLATRERQEEQVA